MAQERLKGLALLSFEAARAILKLWTRRHL